MEKLTKIMWLEEDLFTIDKFKAKATEYDLDFQVFNCWDDAYNALKSNIKGWGAVVLNPKCKLGRGDRPKPHKFLPQVFCDIAAISAKFDVVIPWYVFTDCDPYLFEDLVVKDRLKYDAEWERPYYSMKEDSENLFYRIKMQTSSIDRTKIREGIHKEFFDKMSALTTLEFTKEDVSTMEDIFISLYENKENKRCNFINLRKIIESLCKSMIKINILPNDMRNAMGEINISACVRLLSVGDCTCGYYKYYRGEKVFDNVSASNLYNILNACNGYAHSESTIRDNRRKETNKYLESTQTNNLLHACALMLADIIIIYYNYIRDHINDSNPKVFWTKSNV